MTDPTRAVTEIISVGDLYFDDTVTVRERGERIAHRLGTSRWIATLDDWEPARHLVTELANLSDEWHFSRVWNALMDEADYYRVHLDLIAA